ncbi:hypothetical protein AVEN_34809-1 [Araneus ventricosus]|uniref:Uncharacterized protein n=1 Tax=Araneus ventricosus TaxID=182803 RepID=A0A4Y2N3Z9_ARAVE|nr:hypothetical protein AVEN_34809-1 [Araneus ventricosus]
MKIGIDRVRNSNSNEVVFPLEWMAIKMKYDSSRRAINHRWEGIEEAFGRGKVRGSCGLTGEISAERESALSGTRKSPVWGGGELGGSQSGGRRSRGGGSKRWQCALEHP